MPSSNSKKKLLSILKILISLGLALLLFYYLYKDGFTDTLERLKHVNYFWVVISLLIGITAHWLRAYRWKLLLEPTGHYPSLGRSLIALLIGYLVNLAVPRLGEVSRCLVLKRTDQIPVTSSLGTVVSERVLDVLTLLSITGIALLIEFDKLNEFITDLFADKLSGIYLKFQDVFMFLVAGVFVLIIIWTIARKQIKKSGYLAKIRSLGRDIWLGCISITRLNNPAVFWTATAGIWILYYWMGFVVFFAMEPTAHLEWRAGLALLVMGGVAMSAPVQGGIGAYHLLVAGLLIYYGVTKEDGLSFAFLLHSSQMILILFAGTMSGLWVLLMSKKKQTPGDADG